MNAEQSLRETVDPSLFLIGSDVDDRYAVDWSGENACRPEVVLRPRSTEDVSAMLQLCHAAKQPVVVQGGMTGTSGGATPKPGEWAMSLERLNNIFEIDSAGMSMTVGAGTPLETIQVAAREAGCLFPLDFGARGSCLAGGVVATNAGGNKVIRYGTARALVLGLVAVLADGEIIPARNKLLKNNAGFDLKQLFIGSEGTLGVVTEVTLRLAPYKPHRSVALCALQSFADVIELLQTVGREIDSLSAYEVMWRNYYQAAANATAIADPFDDDHNYYVLIETEGMSETDMAASIESVLFHLMEAGGLSDVVIAQSEAEAARFWRIRDGISELARDFDPAVSIDIGIPVAYMDDFANEIQEDLRVAFPNCRVLVFGHIGDGNLHMVATTGRKEDQESVYDMIYRKTGEVGGAITAEHGVGVLKKPWLGVSRSEAEIDLMRRLKGLLDPLGIINPGRVI